MRDLNLMLANSSLGFNVVKPNFYFISQTGFNFVFLVDLTQEIETNCIITMVINL